MQTFPEVFYFTYVAKIIGNLDSFGFGKKGKILGIAIRRKATGYFENALRQKLWGGYLYNLFLHHFVL